MVIEYFKILLSITSTKSEFRKARALFILLKEEERQKKNEKGGLRDQSHWRLSSRWRTAGCAVSSYLHQIRREDEGGEEIPCCEERSR